jgi:hypothetical protein
MDAYMGDNPCIKPKYLAASSTAGNMYAQKVNLSFEILHVIPIPIYILGPQLTKRQSDDININMQPKSKGKTYNTSLY